MANVGRNLASVGIAAGDGNFFGFISELGRSDGEIGQQLIRVKHISKRPDPRIKQITTAITPVSRGGIGEPIAAYQTQKRGMK